MDPVLKFCLLITSGLMALIAGLFYSYSCSVNAGLAHLSDLEYMKAMKSINRAILNPWFFLSFMGTLVMAPLTTGLYYRSIGVDMSFYLLLISSLIYVVTVFGITIIGNVPLNKFLDSLNIEMATAAELHLERQNFEIPWNRFHAIRTFANVVALFILLFSIVRRL